MSRTLSLPVIEPVRAVRAEAGPFLKPEGRVLATLELDGRRRWLRPRLSPGGFWRKRLLVAWVLIALYTVIPWLTVDGMPMVLLDLVERKFVFFGTVFRPTETLLFGVLFLAVFVAIFLLTAVFGRVWCGWACPQTVYMEFVYRPIERFFLGKGYANPKVAVSAWRRAGMYAVYVVVSAHLANTLLAWFVGADRLTSWIFTGTPATHPVAFMVFAAVTGLMMFDFAFFREQMCSLVCPYGRLQSALLDRDSLIVGYDRKRGEPRGKGAWRGAVPTDRAGCAGKCGCDGRGGCGSGGGCDGGGDAGCPAGEHAEVRPSEASAAELRGDCVDCRMCVVTCPAGIDIRDGLQLECIHCTQCIDACDAVMAKLGRPTGLIRYSSQRALDSAPRKSMRVRLIVYPALLTALLAAAAYLLATRQDAAVAVLRTQGVPYAMKPVGSVDGGTDGHETIESIVRMRIDNRTRAARWYVVTGGEGVTLVRDERIEVVGDASREIDVVVRSAPAEFVRGRRDVVLEVREEGDRGGAFRGAVRASVLGPLVIAPLKPDAGDSGAEVKP